VELLCHAMQVQYMPPASGLTSRQDLRRRPNWVMAGGVGAWESALKRVRGPVRILGKDKKCQSLFEPCSPLDSVIRR